MKTLIACCWLACCAPSLLAQTVILPLDKGYPEDQFHFLTYNAESALELKSNSNGHNGKSAGAAWRLTTGPGDLGYTGFGYLHPIALPANPFPDLTPYSHLSLWYNNVKPTAQAQKVSFRFELYERDTETDDAGQRGNQIWIYQSSDILSAPTGWTRLLMPLQQVDQLGGNGFAIRPGGFQGNGIFDRDRIKYWAVLLLVEGEPAGTVFSGTTLFDYLTAETLPPVAAEAPVASFVDALYPNYPNPFTAATTIAYTLQRPGEASLKTYDMLGREVAVLVSPRWHESGRHEVLFDGSLLAAGSYLCVLEIEGIRHTRLVTRLR